MFTNIATTHICVLSCQPTRFCFTTHFFPLYQLLNTQSLRHNLCNDRYVLILLLHTPYRELLQLNASHLKSELPASTTTAFLTSYLVDPSYTVSTGVNSDSSYPIVYSYAVSKILNPSTLMLIAEFQSLSMPLCPQ